MRNAIYASSTTTTRRTVLRTAGLAAVAVSGAAAVAACGTDTPSATPSASAAPETSAPSSSDPSSPSPAASEAESTEEELEEETPSGPSVATADVAVGGGVVMDDADYVVTQPAKGDFKAFTKICTHMGCPVARVADKQIQCDCHQSKYSISDGSVISGPASKPLQEYDVEVSGGKAYVQA